MCRCEMLDVDNSHLVKEKVTGSFRSAGGRRGGNGWQKRERARERRKLRKKTEREEEDKREGESESPARPQQHSWEQGRPRPGAGAVESASWPQPPAAAPS